MTKKTTKTSSKESATTTPMAPEWVQTPVQNLMGNYDNLFNTTSAADTYAPANDLQNRAYGYDPNAGSGYTTQAAKTLGQGTRYNAPQVGFSYGQPAYSAPTSSSQQSWGTRGGGDANLLSYAAATQPASQGGWEANFADPNARQAPNGDIIAEVTGQLNASRKQKTGPYDTAQPYAGETDYSALYNSMGLNTQAPSGYTGSLSGQSYSSPSSGGARLSVAPTPTLQLPTAAQAQYTAAQTAANPTQAYAYAPDPITAARVGDLGERGFAAADRPTIDQNLLNYDVVQANAGGVQARQAKEFLNDYQPYANSALVAATMQSFNDQAGREKAAFEAQAAGSKAFGGSRSAIAQAQLGSDLARQGALTRAQMEDAAFTRAAGLAQGDADRFLSGDVATANNSTQASIANAQLGTQANRDKGQWAMDRYGIDANMNMFNAGQANDAYSQIFGENAANMRQDAMSANDIAKLIYGTEAGLNQFNAGQSNDLASLIYGTQSGMNQFNAGQANDMSQFNTGQVNSMGQFNAGLQSDILQNNADRALASQGLNLSAANSLGDLGLNLNADARAGAQTDMTLGADQERLQMAEQLSPFVYQQLLQQGIDPALLSLFIGQQIDSTSTGKQTQSGGLGAALLSAAAQVGSAAAMSERRVKRDIVKQGEDSDGLGWYSFRYVWDDDSAPVRFGTMVDEVERIRPWALGPVVDGIRTVDYSKLETAQ